jgi:hypothetical protein
VSSAPHVHATGVVTTIDHQAIFIVKIRINFVDPAKDNTMAPDGASLLREHFNMRPSSRLRDVMPPRPIIIDAARGMPLNLVATSS